MATELMKDETMLERYSDMTELRALLQLIPFGIGSAIDSFAGNKADRIRFDRIKLLLQSFSEDLSKLQESSINKEFICSDDFLLLFNKTLDSSEKERSKEKILFFKNLLVNSITEKEVEIDFIDTMIDILRDLSYSECLILSELHNSNSKTKSYQTFSSVDNTLAPYFVSKLKAKGLIDSNNQSLVLTDISSRLIEVTSKHG